MYYSVRSVKLDWCNSESHSEDSFSNYEEALLFYTQIAYPLLMDQDKLAPHIKITLSKISKKVDNSLITDDEVIHTITNESIDKLTSKNKVLLEILHISKEGTPIVFYDIISKDILDDFNYTYSANLIDKIGIFMGSLNIMKVNPSKYKESKHDD